jgi:sugar phosphate isomerase/epimerase
MFGAKGVLDNAPLPPYQFPGDIPVVRHYDEDVLSGARLPDALCWREHWTALTGTYRQACDIARSFGLNYLMHPCLGALAATTDAFLYFRDAVGRENLRFNLDTANQFAMKENLNLCLVRLADAIDYIHISDNRGERVEHLPIGAGRINWDGFFETLDRIGYRGDFGIDIGGDESGVGDLDRAYGDAIRWLGGRLSGASR